MDRWEKKASSSSDLVRKRGRDVLLVVLITEEQAQRGERFVQSCCSSPGKHLRLHELNFLQHQNPSMP